MRYSAVSALSLVAGLLVSTECLATTYYVSAAGQDGSDGQAEGSAWRTIGRVNTAFSKLVAGDSVLFRRGDTFTGSVVVSAAGKSGQPITIGAYGSGDNPVLTGLGSVTGWKDLGGGVYEAAATSPATQLNLVTLDGVPQRVGRYPNASEPNGGYLTYESFAGATSITDTDLPGTPDWTGCRPHRDADLMGITWART
jgi:hypothetical protein